MDSFEFRVVANQYTNLITDIENYHRTIGEATKEVVKYQNQIRDVEEVLRQAETRKVELEEKLREIINAPAKKKGES